MDIEEVLSEIAEEQIALKKAFAFDEISGDEYQKESERLGAVSLYLTETRNRINERKSAATREATAPADPFAQKLNRWK